MKSAVGGSIYLIGLGLILALVGGAFTWLLGRSFIRAQEMDSWVRTDCVILESEVRERQIGIDVPVDYSFGLLFGYEYEGKRYASDRFDLRGNAWVKEKAKIQRLAKAFPLRSQQTCIVNPAKPDFAVLKRESKAPGYSIWFPILFLVGGLGVMGKAFVAILRQKSKPTA